MTGVQTCALPIFNLCLSCPIELKVGLDLLSVNPLYQSSVLHLSESSEMEHEPGFVEDYDGRDEVRY